MKSVLFLFVILGLSSCGWSVDEEEPTGGGGLIGKNLTVNLDRNDRLWQFQRGRKPQSLSQ